MHKRISPRAARLGAARVALAGPAGHFALALALKLLGSGLYE